MGGYFDEIERQLADRCEQGAHRRRAFDLRWRRNDWRRAGAVVALAGSVLVVAVVVALAVGLRTGHRGPGSNQTPSRPAALTAHQRRAVGADVAAAIGQAKRRHACHPAHTRMVREGSPDRALLSILGVLRRPATAADRLPGAGVPPGRDIPPWADASGAFVKYIRLARVLDGTSYYLIPVARAGQLTARCVALAKRDLRRQLHRQPRSLRAAMLAQGIRAIEQSGPHQGVILREQGKINGGDGPASAAQIEHPLAIGGSGGRDQVTFAAIVPDGVAKVELDQRAVGPSSRSAASAHPFSITVPVVNNVLVARVPRAALPLKTIWLRANGSVIKTL